MYFNSSVHNTVFILFKNWKINSLKGLFGSFFAVIAIAMTCECLKLLLNHMLMVDRWKLYKTPSIQNQSVLTEKRVTRHLHSTLLYLLQLLLAYLLMMVAMTFNAWLFIAILIGCSLGYYIFAPIAIPLTVPGDVKTINIKNRKFIDLG